MLQTGLIAYMCRIALKETGVEIINSYYYKGTHTYILKYEDNFYIMSLSPILSSIEVKTHSEKIYADDEEIKHMVAQFDLDSEKKFKEEMLRRISLN